ncbi:SPFH domain-containing protein [uncultured Aquimarina sp.]|uniref:SPFH domain-containing protein n=1 Tax=uncultured Aquimarina sp. TaxID=575652 RepID=UPI0026045CEA|nr:SPFH domain-containing protein [uncultured Aquimarina sp.]
MKNEKNIKVQNGYLFFGIVIVSILALVIAAIKTDNPELLFLLPIGLIAFRGFFIVNPNSSKVMVLFGAYKGTVRDNGFFWANPFYTRQKISLRARNFDSERVKVNDKIGNPIMINVILVWKVSDTFKAAFDVNDYQEFVKVQTDAAVRKLAGSYPYDSFDDAQADLTLRSGMDEVNEALENEITERLSMAGIEVMEARIGYLAYAPEIASSMLKRQQAVAIVAARKKIVEGAVGMVEDALDKLSADGIIEFDDEKKASMVSNLMIVLCGDKEATPVINTGTLNS